MNLGKTKIFSALFALLTALQSAGVIHLNPEILVILQNIFGAGVVWGFRDAISKNGSGR